MKQLLGGTLVAIVFASATVAQVPSVQIYFEGNPVTKVFQTTQSPCQPPGTMQDLYIVFQNFNMYVLAVDFSVDYPPALLWTGETVGGPAGQSLTIGSSPSGEGFGGIAIAFFVPQSTFEPFLAMISHVIWTGSCDCHGGPQPLKVRGYQYAHLGNGGKANPQVVRWPDFAELDGVGMTSLVCPSAWAVEPATWGRVKALYR